MGNKKTILITGGCGIIASGIIKGLISEGHNLILIDTSNLLNVSILERLVTVVYTIFPLIFIFWVNRSRKLNN